MKAIVLKSNLKEGLTIISGAVNEKLHLPILKHILLYTKEKKTTLTATNLEIAITTTVPSKVIEEGRTTLPFSLFSSVIGSLPEERINLETTKQHTLLKTDNYEATFHSLSPDEFPLIPSVHYKDQNLQFEGGVLRNALAQVIYATQTSEFRPELNSIFLNYNTESVVLAGTDSFRLAEKKLTSPHIFSTHETPFTLLIPLTTAHELQRILKNDEQALFYRDASQILIKTPRTEFVSRLAEGTFPDYQGIVPKAFDAEVVVGREEFMDALKLVGVFSGKTNEIKIKPLANKKGITLSSVGQIIGENAFHLPAKFHGDIGEIGFNWKYLVDGLRALSTDEIYLGLNNGNRPAMLKSPGDTSYFYIVMPTVGA